MKTEWVHRKLIDLADYYNGMAFKPSDWVESGIKIIRIEQLNNPMGNYDYYQGSYPEINAIHNEDLIFSWSATLKVAIWKWGEGVLNQHLFKVVPFENVDKYFLYYLLDYNMPKLGESSHGSTMKHIKRKELETYSVSIPSSLPAQRRIAAILSSADKVIASTQKVIAKYKQMKQGLMEDLLKPKEGWKMVRLGEVGKISMCKRVFSFETSTEGEIPFYKIGTFGKTADAFISRQLFEEYKSKFSYPQVGDILISASGTIGRTVVFDGEPAYFQDSNIIWIDNDEQIVLNQFLYYLYQTITWNLEGSTIARLYNDNFNKIEISVPFKNDKPDLTKQRRIAAILSGIDAKIAAEEKVLEKYEKVKKGMMERMMEDES